MPKITEPTVAQHRAARVAALLEATVALITEDPHRAPSLGEVGRRAGLSRSSVYHYFASSDDLLAAVVEDTFPRWERRFDAAYDGVADPRERVRVYVRENLRLVADGEHALARTLASVAPGDHLTQRATALNERLLLPLTEALTELGVADPPVTASLLRSLVLAGARLVEETGDLRSATAAVLDLVDPFLDGRTVERGGGSQVSEPGR